MNDSSVRSHVSWCVRAAAKIAFPALAAVSNVTADLGSVGTNDFCLFSKPIRIAMWSLKVADTEWQRKEMLTLAHSAQKKGEMDVHDLSSLFMIAKYDETPLSSGSIHRSPSVDR